MSSFASGIGGLPGNERRNGRLLRLQAKTGPALLGGADPIIGDIAAHLDALEATQLLASFVEVESGKRDDRPELARAMEHARLTGAVLLIAKLDRLSRDADFLLGLQKAGVRFVAADMIKTRWPSPADSIVGDNPLLSLILEAVQQPDDPKHPAGQYLDVRFRPDHHRPKVVRGASIGCRGLVTRPCVRPV
jgi:Resolvase, N terminal domain